jgi:hypothetical protein
MVFMASGISALPNVLERLLNKNRGVVKTLTNQNIYSLASFNAATSNYNYNVNPNTGVVTPTGNPYQFQLGLRYGF